MELDVLQQIVKQHGVECYIKDKPLIYWCLKNHKALKWLLNHNANPNTEICIHEDKRVTALWLAKRQTSTKHWHKVRRLLHRYGGFSIRFSDFVSVKIKQ